MEAQRLGGHRSAKAAEESLRPGFHDRKRGVRVINVHCLPWPGAAGSEASGKRAVVLHWNGTRWRAADFDFPRDRGEVSKAVAAPGGTAWAVGYARDKAAVFRFT